MSPNKMRKCRQEFERAVSRFGWKKTMKKTEWEHYPGGEWTEEVWTDRNGDFLISESDLSENFVRELIRIANETDKVM